MMPDEAIRDPVLEQRWRAEAWGGGRWRIVTVGSKEDSIVLVFRIGRGKELANHLADLHNASLKGESN